MCGIFGHISNRKLEISHNLMPRRGPDGWGCEHRSDSGYELTFFHSRLQIIGLGEQGKQPMTLPDGSLLVFNGEIYNYRELREELEREKGCEFTTRTDTEVLLMALRHWPLKDVLDKVNGIFAFGFYDAPAHRLIVARDHLGVKPVYFHADGNSFSFSSEIKAMFACGVAEPRLNETCLGEYFANGWICEQIGRAHV